MSERVQIKPEMLEWARERARLTLDEIREVFPKYSEWVSGAVAPTFKQLERYAAKTFAPIGYLFLDSPPEEPLPVPDFRTVADEGVSRPSPHLLDTIYAMQRRQEWMRDFLIDKGEPCLGFVASRSLDDAPKEVAESIRDELQLDLNWSNEHGTWEDALRDLVRRIEEIGVMVMINGVVGNNTHRPLDVGEFRGFVICDEIAPLIFINGRDAKAAQMFTLIHELAHLWLGEGGLTNFMELLPAKNRVERFCNEVAAEVLVPAQEALRVWNEEGMSDAPFQRLARRFKVSPIVAARRALDLDLIDRNTYFEFYRAFRKESEARMRKSSPGGDFYRTAGARLGQRFSAAVYVAAKEGRLGYRDAFELTGLRGAAYDRFGGKFGLPV